MILVICHPGDEAANLFTAYANRIYPGKFRLVNADILTAGMEWQFRLSNYQVPTFCCSLYKTGKISTEDVDGVFNRLQYIHPGLWEFAAPVEKSYAEQEFCAFFLGWLLSFKAKITNLPHPVSLSGKEYDLPGWRMNAAKLGIRALDYETGTDPSNMVSSCTRHRIVYVIGNQVIGNIPGMPPAHLMIRLARENDLEFLEIRFSQQGKRWLFDTATSFPAIFHTSGKCMSALTDHLFNKTKSNEYGFNLRHSV